MEIERCKNRETQAVMNKISAILADDDNLEDDEFLSSLHSVADALTDSINWESDTNTTKGSIRTVTSADFVANTASRFEKHLSRRQEKIEKLKRAKLLDEISLLKDKPTINASSAKSMKWKRPIYESPVSRPTAKPREIPLTPERTVQPTSPSKQRRTFEDWHNDTMSWLKHSKISIATKERTKKSEETKNNIPKPNINPRSSRMAKTPTRARTPIHERLNSLTKNIANVSVELEQCTFTPQTCPKSSRLVRHNRPNSAFKRLYSPKKERPEPRSKSPNVRPGNYFVNTSTGSALGDNQKKQDIQFVPDFTFLQDFINKHKK